MAPFALTGGVCVSQKFSIGSAVTEESGSLERALVTVFAGGSMM